MNPILEAVDRFGQEKLSETEGDQEVLLSFVLEQSRSMICGLLPNADGNLSAAEISQAYSDLKPENISFDEEVLANIGYANLAEEIIERVNAVLWAQLMQHLRSCVPRGQTFYPSSIQNRDRELYNAIRSFLQNGEDNGVDWEEFKQRMPEDLKRWFETQRLSPEEKRRRVEQETLERIENDEQIQRALVMFAGDRKKLALALRTLGLSNEEVGQIIFVSFKGLRSETPEPKLLRLMRDYDNSIQGQAEIISDYERVTGQAEVELVVRVPSGASRLYVHGPTRFEAKMSDSSAVVIRVPLKIGEVNDITLVPYHEEAGEDEVIRTRSNPTYISIKRSGKAIDVEAFFKFLEGVKDDIIESIAETEEKSRNFNRRLEEFLIKEFAESFEQGERTVLGMMEKHKDNPFARTQLETVLAKFREVSREEYPSLRPGRELFFFQKYCIYEIRRRRAEGYRGVILANEPGLGKTVTALAATFDDEVLIACPNSVASTWIEQEGYFFNEPFLLNLSGTKYSERKRMLRRNAELAEQAMPGVITNIEFVRSKNDATQVNKRSTDQKFDLLNQRNFPGRERANIIDEMHFLKNDSQQTEGVGRLKRDFDLWLSASPTRDPVSFCRIMSKLLPEDDRFKSLKAFRLAFPKDDAEALQVLNLIQQEYVIRFSKSDVMRECDPEVPLDEQRKRLPKKVHIEAANEQSGLFTLTGAQQQAIYELFLDWEAWKKKYDKYMPDDQWAREDNIRKTSNQLVKKHALRQIINNPEYIGSDEPSPKHRAMRNILEEELSQAGTNKGLVFCRYHAQVDAYASMLDEMGIEYAQCTGRIAAEGFKKDASGQEMYFKMDEFGNPEIGEDGRPIPTTKRRGKKMDAMDYERHVFQNDPNCKIMLSTYQAGGVGKTFTAATFCVEDDKPEDYTARYQAEDRIHRIDEERPKYIARYYSLTSEYSEDFLSQLPEILFEKNRHKETVEFSPRERWFAQGTVDSVQEHNLRAQRTMFEIINDGIDVDSVLMRGERSFNFG